MIPDALYPSLLYCAVGLYLVALVAFAMRREIILHYSLPAGIALHTAFLFNRASFSGAWNWIAFFEQSFFLPLCMALIALAACRVLKASGSAGSFMIPAFAVSLYALFLPIGIMPPSPFTDTIYSALFFSFEAAALALFLAAGWSAVLFLAFNDQSKWFHSLIVWGFVAYSIAQVTGAVWSYLGWSAPFCWNSRHLQSGCIWCFYAALLHIRFMKQWTMRTEAGLSVLGMIALILFSVLNLSHESGLQRIGG